MPEVLERCIAKVMDEGHDKDQAYAICRASLGLAADGADDKKSLTLSDAELDAALKPNLAPKKTESRIVNYALADEMQDDIGENDHVVETLPNGDVMKEVPLALMGKDFQNGPYSFDLTEEKLAVIIRNFEERGQPIPITIGHYPPEERQRQPAAAWIHKLFARDGKLWGLVKFLKETWADITAGKFKGFSMEFWTESTDVHGNEIGMQIDGGALTNYPFFPVRVDNAAQRKGHSLLTLTAFTGHGAGSERSSNVAETQKTEETAPKKTTENVIEKDGQRVTLSQRHFEDHYERAVRDAEGLRGELAVVRGTVEKHEKTIAAQAHEIQGRRIQAAIAYAQSEGVVIPLGDYAIDNHTEAIEWLKNTPAPFYVNTIEGLEKFVHDKDRMAPLRKLSREAAPSAGRIEEGATGVDEVPDLSTKEAREEAVRTHVRKLRAEYQPHEIAMLTKKHGSLEAFAKLDLRAMYGRTVVFE